MRYHSLFISLLILFISSFALGGTELNDLARKAISSSAAESELAVKQLRSKKQIGLDALFAEYSKQIKAYKSGESDQKEWIKIAEAIDAVAKQKDAYSSRLFWYTNLNEAMKDASASGKPILSLRLLGGLDEEYSCANSRFFRSLLYSDPAISGNLRENYVLHWQSVRPAPKITIDFGDGRTLIRTITGNSIHYVLNSHGAIIDALPGLYSPVVFNSYLNRINESNRAGRKSRREYLRYREEIGKELVNNWRKQLSFLGKSELGLPKPPRNDRATAVSIRPTAIDAAPLAVSKMVVERSTLNLLSRQFERLNRRTEKNDWLAIAELNGPVEISPQSIALMRTKTRNLSNKEFASLIANTRKYLAIDTAQNEYRFHTTLITWLGTSLPVDLNTFNARVYSNLFLTPDSDKWLGLYAPDIYSAIDNNGVH
jgi:hypothetical protein